MRISDWSSDVCSSDLAMTASTRLAPISRSAPIADAIRLLLAAGKPMPRTLMQQLARHIPALQIEHVKTGHDAINRLRDQAGIHVLLIDNTHVDTGLVTEPVERKSTRLNSSQ